MTAPEIPERYKVGGSPHDVLVPADIALWLHRKGLGKLRTAARGESGKADAVLMALHESAMEHLTAVRGRTAVPPLDEMQISSRGAGPHLDAVAVAELLGCKPRNVRDLAARRRLHGDRVGGRWLFTPEVVDAYVAERATD